MQFGNSREEHRKRVAERTQALGNAAAAHDLELTQAE